MQRKQQKYDDQGALLYVTVVLCIYAFSIILMIGETGGGVEHGR